jgi:hypothetical protein
MKSSKSNAKIPVVTTFIGIFLSGCFRFGCNFLVSQKNSKIITVGKAYTCDYNMKFKDVVH